jgi:hypothetical protein
MSMECPTCPSCQSEKDVFPVSRIYIAGITRETNRNEADRSVLRVVYGDANPQEDDFWQRSLRFAPPHAAPPPPRPLHPDLIAGFGLVFLIVLVGNVFAASHRLWLAPLWVGLGSGILYLLARPRWLGFYRAKMAQYRTRSNVLMNALERWHRTYFCAREELLFEAGEQAATKWGECEAVELEKART